MDKKYETITLERVSDHTLLITFNRPEVANASNTLMGLEVKEVFEGLYLDQQDFRCVVMTGRGDKAFSAGGDLKERNGMTDAQWRKQHAIFEQSVLAMRACP